MTTVISDDSKQEIQNNCPKYLNWNARLHIAKCINALYKRGILPNFNDVYESVEDELRKLYSTISEFISDMKLLGYIYKEMPYGHILIENPELTFERYFYLKNMIKYRQTKAHNFYYIDQRVIDTTLNFPKRYLQNADASEDNTLVFLYVVSVSNSKVVGMFTNVFDYAQFNKWITDILLDYVKPNSVMVIDSNYKRIMSQKSQKEITMYDTKDDILKWLKTNNVPCSRKIPKAELFELYKKTPKKHTNCDFAAILESRGHHVLYLPTNIPDLCPTNYLWKDISRKIKLKDSRQDESINSEGLIHTLVTKITALTMPITKTNFKAKDKIIERREKLIFELDTEIEDSLDNLMQTAMDTAHKQT